jgi:hypothetical protein
LWELDRGLALQRRTGIVLTLRSRSHTRRLSPSTSPALPLQPPTISPAGRSPGLRWSHD